jgi:hypothetical protein
MIPDPAGNVETWEVHIMVTILLRQFKRLLAEQGVDLTDTRMREIGEEVAARNHPADADRINAALAPLVGESEGVLAELGLTFAQSLATGMNDLSDRWETTADFLDLANEKGNAELRITAGASLMALLGDVRYVQHLLAAIAYDLETSGRLDVDAAIARRALLHSAGIDADDADWLARVREWAADQA